MELTEVKRLISLCQFEDEALSYGYINVAGVDEAGRGSLAGPIVAAAVILNRNKILIEKLNDSKKLSRQQQKPPVQKDNNKQLMLVSSESISRIIDRISLRLATLVIKKTINCLRRKPDIIITDALNPNMKITYHPNSQRR